MAGIYQRNVMLASGRYAVLDDGMAFGLVRWKLMIEQRLSQQLAAGGIVEAGATARVAYWATSQLNFGTAFSLKWNYP